MTAFKNVVLILWHFHGCFPLACGIAEMLCDAMKAALQ